MFLVAKYYYANNDLRRAHTRKKYLSAIFLQKNTTTINGNKVIIGRYAVWSPLKDKPGHMIIEVGNDLAQLQQKYNISDSLVFKFLK